MRERGEGATNLHFNVQDYELARLGQILNRSLACAVPIPPKHGILHKFIPLNHGLELSHGDIVVVDIARLTWAWVAGGVGDGCCKDTRVFAH